LYTTTLPPSQKYSSKAEHLSRFTFHISAKNHDDPIAFSCVHATSHGLISAIICRTYCAFRMEGKDRNPKLVNNANTRCLSESPSLEMDLKESRVSCIWMGLNTNESCETQQSFHLISFPYITPR